MTNKTRYWLIVASADHVANGVTAGFCQACHGKAYPLRRMEPGDGILFYSPRRQFGGPPGLQAFTAAAYVADGPITQVEMAPGFRPHRRSVVALATGELPIRPLLPQLSFIRDLQHWGAVFRFGFLEITAADFQLVSQQLQATSIPTI